MILPRSLHHVKPKSKSAPRAVFGRFSTFSVLDFGAVRSARLQFGCILIEDRAAAKETVSCPQETR